MSKGGSTRLLLRRHGSKVKIFAGQDENGQNAYALIQPIRYKNKRYFDGDFVQGGLVDSRHYLYIGTPDVRIDLLNAPIIVRRENENYTVRRSEAVHLGNECIYVWAIMQPYVQEYDGR